MKFNLVKIIHIVFIIFSMYGCSTIPVSTPSPTTSYEPSPSATVLASPTSYVPASSTPIPAGGTNKIVIDNSICIRQTDCNPSIYLYDVVTKQKTLILEGYYLEGISPEGTRLLVSNNVRRTNFYYIEHRDLYSINLDGTNLTLLSENYKRTYIAGVFTLYWYDKEDLIFFIEKDNLCSIKPDGSDYKQITHSTSEIESFLPRIVDGEIYWQEKKPNPTAYEWYKSKLDGTGIIRLGHIEEPFISPDGKMMAYLYEFQREIFFAPTDNLAGMTNIINAADFSDYILETQGKTIDDFIYVRFSPLVWLPDNQGIITFLEMVEEICTNCGTEKIYSQPIIIKKNGEVLYLDEMTEYHEPFYFSTFSTYSVDNKLITYDYTKSENDVIYREIKALDLDTMKTITMVSISDNTAKFYPYFWVP